MNKKYKKQIERKRNRKKKRKSCRGPPQMDIADTTINIFLYERAEANNTKTYQQRQTINKSPREIPCSPKNNKFLYVPSRPVLMRFTCTVPSRHEKSKSTAPSRPVLMIYICAVPSSVQYTSFFLLISPSRPLPSSFCSSQTCPNSPVPSRSVPSHPVSSRIYNQPKSLF